MNMEIGILGAGFSGRKIGALFAKEGCSVWGTSRRPERFESLEALNIAPILFDSAESGSIESSAESSAEHRALFLQALERTSHLIVSIAPPRSAPLNAVPPSAKRVSAKTDPFLQFVHGQSAGASLKSLMPNLAWIGYLSTIGVYGHHNGKWIDETTEPKPVSERSRQRLQAETEWHAAAEEADLPLAIFRLSGIYGPGRNALRNAHLGKARRLVKEGQVFNRVHVDDIASALWLAARQKAQGLFNITDDEPAAPQNIVLLAHELMNLEPPPEQSFETADLTPMARSFYGENKRVRNAKSKEILAMTYSWPNYRMALKKMHERDDWR